MSGSMANAVVSAVKTDANSLSGAVADLHSIGGFGNAYLSQQGFNEIYLAGTVSWWPQTLAWKLALAMLLVFLLLVVVAFVQRYRRNAYRREALARLESAGDLDAQLQQLPEILRATALHAFDRQLVVGLTGIKWLDFLDASMSASTHDYQKMAGHSIGELLLALSYRSGHVETMGFTSLQAEKLLCTAKQWLRCHQLPAASVSWYSAALVRRL